LSETGRATLLSKISVLIQIGVAALFYGLLARIDPSSSDFLRWHLYC